MEQHLVRLSRTLSYALRHNPASLGLTLDAEGWVAVDVVLAALHKRRTEWRHLEVVDIEQMMAQSEKQRFELRGGKIRAFYGHSTPVKIQYQPQPPPAILFHGTTPQAAQIIHSQGLKPMGRQYVHLSAETATARQVALRRTHNPVILVINASQAHRQGIVFYLGNDMVWLAEHIPPEFISFQH